jgi:UDP-glucose 6-dehydrogenase
MNVGIIGSGNLGYGLSNYLSNSGHIISISDKNTKKIETIGYQTYSDNIDVIKNSEIIFCCVDTHILPSNFLDIKNVMNVVEDFGICFEDEIPLYNKMFVICSTLNPGDTKQITEILNPMNLSVSYVPLIVNSNDVLSSLKSLDTLVVGNIDSHVSGKISNLFQNKNLKVVTMTSRSAEIYKLAYSSFIHYKINFANFLGELMINFGSSDETKLLLKSLGYDKSISEEKFDFGFSVGGPWIPTENRVFGQVCNGNKLNFILPFVNDDFNKSHQTYLKEHFTSLNTDKTQPFIVDGIGYKNNSGNIMESSKLSLVYDLLKDGYEVFIVETDEFIKNVKVVKDLVSDFGDKIKFYKKGTTPKGVYINF